MKNLVKIASLVLVGAATTVTAQDTFNLQYYFPNLSSTYDGATSFTADGSTYALPEGDFNVSAASGVLTFTFLRTSSWTPATFNGFTLDLTTGGTFTSVTKDAATTESTFTGSEISLTSPTEFTVNWQSEAFTAGDTVVLDYSAVAAPEPGTLALAGLGIAGLVTARRRSSK